MGGGTCQWTVFWPQEAALGVHHGVGGRGCLQAQAVVHGVQRVGGGVCHWVVPWPQAVSVLGSLPG